MKKQVGYDFPLPPDIKPTYVENVGGYKIAITEEAVYIVGNSVLNLSASPIGVVCVMPVDRRKLMEGADNPHSVCNTCILEDIVYYYVSYNDYAYIFSDLEVALKFIYFLTVYKADALRYPETEGTK